MAADSIESAAIELAFQKWIETHPQDSEGCPYELYQDNPEFEALANDEISDAYADIEEAKDPYGYRGLKKSDFI